jgi:Na+-translocating ferredoxin:NAD+ oxidoreductase RnfG subunit
MRHEWLIPAAGFAAIAPQAQVAYCAEYASVETAQRKAFPDATAFEPAVVAADVKAAVASAAGRFYVDPKVWRVRGGERNLGWFIVDEVIGKQELITYALALDNTGAIIALDILVYRESHGDAIRLPAWRAQFAGKRASDPVRVDADIRNISGATLSCRHVTEGVRRLLLVYERALARG